MDAQAWDARYRDADLVWSKSPNLFVEAEVADLTPVVPWTSPAVRAVTPSGSHSAGGTSNSSTSPGSRSRRLDGWPPMPG